MLNHLRLFLPSRRSALARLYLTVGLLHFGLSLIGIYVPIYIYQLTGSFYWLAAFIGVLSLSVLFSTFPVANLVRKIGIFRAIFVSVVVKIIYLLLLLAAFRFPFLIFLAGILDGMMTPLFWFPYHLIYVQEGRDGQWGHQIGLMNLITILMGIPAPFLGGFVVSNFGFGSLYLLGLGLVLLSSLPLLGVGDAIKIESFSAKEVLKGLGEDDYRPLLFGFGGLRFEGAVGVFLWPLFVFKVARSFTTLGAIASTTVLVGILANFFGAEFIDKVGTRRILPFGAVAFASSWAVLGFATTIPMVFGLVLIRCFLGVLYEIPARAITYSLAQRDRPLEFLMRREFVIHSAGAVLAILLAILWCLFPQSWPILFAPAVVGSLASILLVRAKRR